MSIMSRYLLILSILVLPLSKAFSQINFVFIPEVYGRSIDGLGNFQIQNLSSISRRGQVYISVRENISKSNIVTIASPQFTLNPGNSPFPVGAFINSSFNFAPNSMASLVSQTRNFPPGEYTFCYRFVPVDKSEDFENCFDANIQPLVPISLISPADEDKICQKRPPLSWQPPVPFPPTMRFRLQLTEKKKGAAVENLLMNAPLVFLDNIPSTTISYPSFAADLQEGHTYVWQVVAYQNGIILSRSEIWQFTVECSDSLPADPVDSYRELKSMQNGNYYITSQNLRFSFQNDYNTSKLNYSISDLENSGKAVPHLPDIPLKRGLNKLEIGLYDLDLKSGNHYLLKIYPFNEPEVQVRFIYQESTK